MARGGEKRKNKDVNKASAAPLRAVPLALPSDPKEAARGTLTSKGWATPGPRAGGT